MAEPTSRTRAGGLFIAIYIWVGVFSVLAPTQVWTLANYVLTTREAKRAFGLIGSGAILGWIVGGFVDARNRDAVRHREHAALGGRHAWSLCRARGAGLAWPTAAVGRRQPAGTTSTAGRAARQPCAVIAGSPYLQRDCRA